MNRLAVEMGRAHVAPATIEEQVAAQAALIDELQTQVAVLQDKLDAYNDYFQEIKRANRLDRAQVCACGCGHLLLNLTSETGRRQIYYSEACRKRAYRLRKKTIGVRQRRNKTKIEVKPILRRKKRETKRDET